MALTAVTLKLYVLKGRRSATEKRVALPWVGMGSLWSQGPSSPSLTWMR